jgi:polyprenyl P-hydroxybenzoate/phenylacrylic acid decarboxylase-like protein
VAAARKAGSTGRRVVVAVAAQEGIEVAVRLLQRLHASGTEIHLVIAPAAGRALGRDLDLVRDMATYRYDHDNQAARIASGSYLTEGMVVVPCDSDVFRAIRMGLASDLLLRAADVTLKESRPLVLGLTPSAASAFQRTERPTDLPGLTVVTLSGDVDRAVGSIVDQLAGSTA